VLRRWGVGVWVSDAALLTCLAVTAQLPQRTSDVGNGSEVRTACEWLGVRGPVNGDHYLLAGYSPAVASKTGRWRQAQLGVIKELSVTTPSTVSHGQSHAGGGDRGEVAAPAAAEWRRQRCSCGTVDNETHGLGMVFQLWQIRGCSVLSCGGQASGRHAAAADEAISVAWNRKASKAGKSIRFAHGSHQVQAAKLIGAGMSGVPLAAGLCCTCINQQAMTGAARRLSSACAQRKRHRSRAPASCRSRFKGVMQSVWPICPVGSLCSGLPRRYVAQLQPAHRRAGYPQRRVPCCHRARASSSTIWRCSRCDCAGVQAVQASVHHSAALHRSGTRRMTVYTCLRYGHHWVCASGAANDQHVCRAATSLNA
jgi:hypothetical protein